MPGRRGHLPDRLDDDRGVAPADPAQRPQADRLGFDPGHAHRLVEENVLMAGLVAYSDWCRTNDHPWARQLRESLTAEQLEYHGCKMSATDAIHFVGQAAPALLLFQFGYHDEFISEQEALRYWVAASEPKEMRWYDTDHFFNEQARQDRMAWLGERLGLSTS